LQAVGGRLSVVCGDRQIRKVFTIRGADRFLPIQGMVEQAVGVAGGVK
jgi:hypothetical protein